jgi:glutathione S-transferase
MALELGVPFRHVPIIPAYRIKNIHVADALPHSLSPEFLKINPNGKVPAVVDGELVLHQSLAINLYLAKKHGGPLAPADLPEEARALVWTHWAGTEVEPRAVDILHHRVSYPTNKRQSHIADAAVVALRASFAMLDRDLAKNDGW